MAGGTASQQKTARTATTPHHRILRDYPSAQSAGGSVRVSELVDGLVQAAQHDRSQAASAVAANHVGVVRITILCSSL